MGHFGLDSWWRIPSRRLTPIPVGESNHQRRTRAAVLFTRGSRLATDIAAYRSPFSLSTASPLSMCQAQPENRWQRRLGSFAAKRFEKNSFRMARDSGLDGQPMAARVVLGVCRLIPDSSQGSSRRLCHPSSLTDEAEMRQARGPDATWNWTTLKSMARLLYQEALREPGLAHVVDCLWSVSVSPDGLGRPSHWVLPDGCYSLAVRVKRRGTSRIVKIFMRRACSI